MFPSFNRVISSVPMFDNNQTRVIPPMNTGVESCDLEMAMTDNTINKHEIQNVTEHEDITSRPIASIIPVEYQNISSVVSCIINPHSTYVVIFSFIIHYFYNKTNIFSAARLISKQPNANTNVNFIAKYTSSIHYNTGWKSFYPNKLYGNRNKQCIHIKCSCPLR